MSREVVALLLLALIVLAVHSLAGCAAAPVDRGEAAMKSEPKPRYLTEAQDAHMREVCERPGGCAVIPGQQWRLIEQLLERLGISVHQEGT